MPLITPDTSPPPAAPRRSDIERPETTPERRLRRMLAYGPRCPDCGGPLAFGEGCQLCPVCGYSGCAVVAPA